MTKYRVFTNDVGPKQFSAYCEVKASTDQEALLKGMKACVNMPVGTRVLVLSNNRRDFWPNGKTGHVQSDVLTNHSRMVLD